MNYSCQRNRQPTRLCVRVSRVTVTKILKNHPHVLEKKLKIFAWYDNEWGYANRYAELALKVARSLN